MPYRKNVYILGAGASVQAGAPVLRNFLDRAQALYLDPKSALTDDDRGRLRQVFNWQKKMDLGRAHVEMDLDNLEDLFGLVDLQCQIGNSEASQVREALTFLIEKTLRLLVQREHRHLRAAGYLQFAKLVTRREQDPRTKVWWTPQKRQGARDAIITLNYDTVVEEALSLVDADVDYNIDDGIRENATPVLKLHGSINWRMCTERGCGRIIPISQEVPNVPCPAGGPHHKTTTLIVPPTWNKGSANGAIGRVWARAHHELVEAHRWIIIGYSAPPSDRFFQYLLGSARAENEHLEIVSVFNYARNEQEQAAIRGHYESLFTKSFVARRLHFELGEPFPTNMATIENLTWPRRTDG